MPRQPDFELAAKNVHSAMSNLVVHGRPLSEHVNLIDISSTGEAIWVTLSRLRQQKGIEWGKGGNPHHSSVQAALDKALRDAGVGRIHTRVYPDGSRFDFEVQPGHAAQDVAKFVARLREHLKLGRS